MRSGTIAFLLGILCIQGLPALPDAFYVQYLPLALAAACLQRRGRLVALFLTGLLWCLFRAHLALTEVLPPDWYGLDLVAEGTFLGVPETGGARTRFVFQVQTARPLDPEFVGTPDADRIERPFSGRVRLNWYHAPRLRSGERWKLVLRLRPPRGFANPGGFDYERWLFLNRIRATGYVRSGSPVGRPESGGGLHIDRWRQDTAERIAQRLPNSQAAGIVSALAVGARQGISAEQWSILRNTGTAHLMAISGLHVALVAGFAFISGRFVWSRCAAACLYLPAPKAAAVAALLAGAAYAAMAGFSLPTQRALILLVVLMWCRIAGRRTSFSAALCLALGAVLVADPFSVLGPSLWLSFGAVAVLAIGMLPRVHPHRSPAHLRVWRAWGRAQWVVAVGLAPLLLMFFDQQPLSAPIANAVAVPWMGFLVVPTSIGGALLANSWPEAGTLLLQAAAWGIAALWPFLQWVDGTVPVAPSAGTVPLAWTLLAGAGAILLIMPRELPARWLGGVLLLPALIFSPPAPPPGVLRYTVLDVGHGLSVIVRTHAHTLVFDAGPLYTGGFDAGRRVVAPYLRSQGIRRVDTVIVSHDDADHAGGLDGLMAEIPAATVLDRGANRCVAGKSWRWDGYLFSIIHPRRSDALTGNDGSCVLSVRGLGGRLLITGDIESAAEQILLRRYGDALQSDVLIVPHHGSQTSSTPAFIERVQPTFALISNADGGRRRRPHRRVLARYARAGVVVMETAKSGAISGELNPQASVSMPRGHRQVRRRYWQRIE